MSEGPSDGPRRPLDGDLPTSGDDPEQIGSDLFRQLDLLDDRLQRSQAQMIALLDQRLGGAEPVAGESEPGEPPVAVNSVNDAVRPTAEVPISESEPSGQVWAAPATEAETATETGPVEVAPTRRPAWLSNAITVVVAAGVVFVALFLVGLF